MNPYLPNEKVKTKAMNTFPVKLDKTDFQICFYSNEDNQSEASDEFAIMKISTTEAMKMK